jgi:hypothetical protein
LIKTKGNKCKKRADNDDVGVLEEMEGMKVNDELVVRKFRTQQQQIKKHHADRRAKSVVFLCMAKS